MKKKQIYRAFVLSIILFAWIGYLWYNENGKETEPEFVFTYAENQPEGYPTTLGGRKFAELVEERTNGRIKILVFANGKLGAEGEVIRQLQYGAVDFARVSLSELSGAVPKMNVLQMPYLYTDSAHMWRILDGSIGDSFLEEPVNQEMIGLSWYDAGSRNFYNMLKPVRSPDDMKGMRIRVQDSALMKDVVEALGATAVPIDYSEVYAALERGEVDGAENNWPSYEATQHYEVAPYYTLDEHTRIPEIQLGSKHTWEKLSEQDQQVILECAKESAVYERELWREREGESRSQAERNGAVAVELSAQEKELFYEAVQGVYEKYCCDYKDIIKAIRKES